MAESVSPPDTVEPPSEVRTAHSLSFPPLLRQLGISLLVTTYQAGKLLVVRADGDILNVLCRDFPTPMGLVERNGELMIGTRHHVWEYYNHVSVIPTLKPPGRFDACYIARKAFVTGDIQIHEMAWARDPKSESSMPDAKSQDEVWIVNTRFSCLCTLDDRHSFVPRWRPPFISALAAEDRCHLNGLGVRNGQVALVTCLGQSDTPAGWRVSKARGGCLLDVPSGEVRAQGLSMPHSPRWHSGQLWVLESGDGSLALVDQRRKMAGCRQSSRLHARYGFLRQHRLHRFVSGARVQCLRRPSTHRTARKAASCGVWAVDLTTGQTLAFLEFESGVREIFAVQVLPGACFPEVSTDDPALIGNSFLLPRA